MLAGLANPELGHVPWRATYRVTWYPDEHVSGQPTNLGFVQQDVSLLLPCWQDHDDEWSAALHLRNESFHTLAILPDTHMPFPQELWNVRASTTYRHLFDNGWIAGGSLSLGSASDQPFHSINEMTAGINAFLRIPQGEHNAWLFTLSYSSNSELPIPIPGVSYVWHPSDQLLMNVGLPFLIVYRPTPDWTFDLSYMLLTNVHARATYRVLPWVLVYGGFDWNDESYLPVGRLDDRDRLYYYEKRLTTGVQVFLCKNASLDFASGYAFDRFYFEGHSLSDSNHNRIDVGDGPFVSLQLGVRW
jgi:hypothetical protein